MPTFQNRVTSAQYETTEMGTLQPTRIITIQVANFPILYQFAVSTTGVASGVRGSAQWMPPEGAPLYPGFWTLREADFLGGPCLGFRVKSMIAGSNAVVNVIA